MRQIITLEKEIAFKTMIGDITSISLEHDLDFISDSEIEGNLIVSGTYKLTEASTIEEDFNYKVPVEIMLTSNLDENKRSIAINNFIYKIVNEEALFITVELLIEGLEKIEVEEVASEEQEEVREEEKKQEEIKEENRQEIVVEEEKNDDNKISEEEKRDEEVLQSMNNNEEVEVLKTDEDDNFKEEKIQNTIEVVNNVEKTKETVNDNNNKEVMDSIFSIFANTEETYATYSVYILRENDNLEEVINRYKTSREVLAEYNDLDNLRVGSKIIIPSNLLETNE